MEDNELAALGSVSKALAELDDDARGRVLRWAADRYGCLGAVNGQGGAPVGPAPGVGAQPSIDEVEADHSEDVSVLTYEHFADLYEATSPASNMEKALVAGYWVQVLHGQASFGSQSLNKELKNLGHGIARINDALASAIVKRPALALQVKRSGNAPQSRKTYKLTVEGVKFVDRMITNGA